MLFFPERFLCAWSVQEKGELFSLLVWHSGLSQRIKEMETGFKAVNRLV